MSVNLQFLNKNPNLSDVCLQIFSIYVDKCMMKAKKIAGENKSRFDPLSTQYAFVKSFLVHVAIHNLQCRNMSSICINVSYGLSQVFIYLNNIYLAL
jgi:hypothetical protein